MSAPHRELPALVDYLLLPLANLTVAFLVSGLVVLAIGENPLEAVAIMLHGALGYPEGIGFTLYYATGFVFTGLAVAVAFHAGLFNIGAEGQATIGGLGVAILCLTFDGAPWWLVAPFALAAAALFGAGWALIPAWLQARRGSHIVITTIMFNYLAATLMVWLLVEVMGKPGDEPGDARCSLEGDPPALPARFPDRRSASISANRRSTRWCSWRSSRAVFVWLLVWRTRFGFELRTVGQNPTAAVYAGIDPGGIVIGAMLISGGLAGLMAVNEVMGVQHRLLLEFTAGAGFVGIAVALMGRSHPFGVVLSALLFGILYQGGAELAFDKPTISRDMIVVIQALVILFAGALEHMFRPALGRIFAPRGDDVGGGRA